MAHHVGIEPLSEEEIERLRSNHSTHIVWPCDTVRLLATLDAERAGRERTEAIAAAADDLRDAATEPVCSAAWKMLGMAAWMIGRDYFGEDDQVRLRFEDNVVRLRNALYAYDEAMRRGET